jgi:hypothetical protein
MKDKRPRNSPEDQEDWQLHMLEQLLVASQEKASDSRAETIPAASSAPELTPEELELVTFLSSEAERNIDILKVHPNLFARILASSRLSISLIEELVPANIIDLAGKLEGFVPVSMCDLTPKPVIQLWPEDRWAIEWTRGGDQLQKVFFPETSEVERFQTYSADTQLKLLRDKIYLGNGLTVQALTIAEQRAPRLNELLIRLSVSIVNQAGGMEWVKAQVTLNWGDEQRTERLDELGRCSLSPISISKIVSQEPKQSIATLKIKLQSLP